MSMIVGELKGGSLSKTVVVKENNQLFVRKYCSYSENREFGLVRWHSQIRRLQYLRNVLGDNVVKVLALGVEDDFYYYDIPYYSEASDCSNFLEETGNCDAFLDQLVLLLKKMSNVRFGAVKGSIAVYLTEEVLVRLQSALKDLEAGPIPGCKSPGILAERIKDATTQIMALIPFYQEYSILETLTHGNLTLENMLWDKESAKLVLIDPYAETYAETLVGDISQIAQSTLSGYEYMVKNKIINDPSVAPYPIKRVPEKIKLFGRNLIDRLGNELFFDESLFRIMHASQFIRMYPFKAYSDKHRALFFLQRGLEILESNHNA